MRRAVIIGVVLAAVAAAHWAMTPEPPAASFRAAATTPAATPTSVRSWTTTTSPAPPSEHERVAPRQPVVRASEHDIDAQGTERALALIDAHVRTLMSKADHADHEGREEHADLLRLRARHLLRRQDQLAAPDASPGSGVADTPATR